jgi:hypothetical protein
MKGTVLMTNVADVIQPMSADLILLGKGSLVMVGALLLWYFFCQWFCRRADQRWQAQLQEIGTLAGKAKKADIAGALQIAALTLARRHSAQGRPSQRLFLGGVGLVGVVALVGMVYFVFIAPLR